ncbi:MAG: hypothetical protein D6732_15505 [Methanobacteriota archaeon]|nr:MAG: hypothetical protein D6732_15505 [Euryarchaeota archaeon]
MEDTPVVQRFNDFLNAAIRVAEGINKMEPPITIHYSNNVDSAVAATIFANVFYSKSQPCHLRNFTKFKELKEEIEVSETSAIIIGVGINEAKQIPEKEEPILILPKQEEKETEIGQNVFSAEPYGYGKELATLSSVAFFIASSLVHDVTSILIRPLVSALANHGAIKGLNEMILHDAIEAGVVEQKTGFKILGSNYFSIAEAIYYSVLPVFPGLTGNKNAVEKMLIKAGVEIEDREGERALEQLSENEMKKLVNAIVVETTGNKFLPETVMPIADIYISKIEPPGSILRYLHEYAQLLRDLEHEDQIHLAIPILLGDRDEIYYSIRSKTIELRKQAIAAFNQIQARPEPERLVHLSFSHSDSLPWQYAQAVSQIMVANGLVPSEEAIAIIARKQNQLAIGLTLPKPIRKTRDVKNLFREIQREPGLGLKIIQMPEGTICLFEKDIEKQVLEKIDKILEMWLKSEE